MRDITGERFGKLTALHPTSKREYRGVVWHCVCDCGNHKDVSRNSLIMGNIKSCGCIHRYVDRESIYKKVIVSRLKERSRRETRLPFEISDEDAYKLSQQPCHYCGLEKQNTTLYKPDNLILFYNGLDRVDSSRGYTDGNVVPCCKRCNAAKNDMTVGEFRDWLQRTYVHYIQKDIYKKIDAKRAAREAKKGDIL